MGRLFEGFEILCTDYDHMTPWKKGGILVKGGHYIRGDIIQGNTVCEGPVLHSNPFCLEKSCVIQILNSFQVIFFESGFKELLENSNFTSFIHRLNVPSSKKIIGTRRNKLR